MTRLTVLDFGMGNLRSVAKALERAGATVDVATDVDPSAGGLVVPGQGHFGSCVQNLGARLDEIRSWIDCGRPYLGICLGLQLLFEGSEESLESGAGVIAGRVARLPASLKVPHIGWNEVVPRPGARLFEGTAAGARFYFVHSYYPVPEDVSVVSATTDYGIEFCCAIERGNLMATQFHPEKSADVGRVVLERFVEVCAS